MPQIRLNKYLASIGIASRRKIDVMTSDHRITINGRGATLGVKVDPQIDQIKLDGLPIKKPAFQSKVYLALNKPLHYVSTVSDDQNRPTVLDLIKSTIRLYPVGRLDFNSTGLILLTNDGDFTLKMTHPRFHLPKIYAVTVDSPVSPNQLKGLTTSSCQVQIQSYHQHQTSLRFILTQGKNRQIRNMCEDVGLKVITLHRISIGPIELGNLKSGQSRPLSQVEILSLKKLGCIV